MAFRFNTYDNGGDLAKSLAKEIAEFLRIAIAQRGQATMAVSGGSTPKAFFKALSGADLDWSRVTVTLVDERFVPPESERSNHALVKAALLQDRASAARFVPLFHAGVDPEDAARLASSQIAALCPFDVVVLGMGTDGHTASFFPGGTNLETALSPETPRSVVTMEAEGAGETRLTLTFSAVSDARRLVLHIEGAAKRPVIDRALQEGKESRLPIGRVIAAAVSDTEIYWAP